MQCKQAAQMDKRKCVIISVVVVNFLNKENGATGGWHQASSTKTQIVMFEVQ